MPGPALQLLLGLDWGASGHVVAVVGAVVVVVVEPGLQGSVEQGEVVDAAAVEMWSVELAQDGAVEAFTDRVVVRGAWRDPVVDQIQGGPGGSEVLAGELGSVVGQDSFEGDAVVGAGPSSGGDRNAPAITAVLSPTMSWTTAIRVATSTAVSCHTAPTPLRRPT